MPIPKPNPDKETQDEFVSRCIKSLSKEDPDRDQKQIIAICYGEWRNRKKESMEEEKYQKDSDGHFIIAENVPFVFNSIMSPVKEETEEPKVEELTDDPKN